MYKTRIRKWGLYKNNRANEVMHMVRIKRQRATVNKDTNFYIRNAKVDWSDIQRYLNRNMTLLTKVQADGVQIGDAARGIVYRTPSPCPAVAFSVPTSLYGANELGDMAQNGAWERFELMYKQHAPPRAYAYLRRWGEVMVFAVHVLKNNDAFNSFQMTACGLENMRHFVAHQNGNLVFYILQLTFNRALSQKPEGGGPISITDRFVMALQAIFGKTYPWGPIWDSHRPMINSNDKYPPVAVPLKKIMGYYEPDPGDSTGSFDPLTFYYDYLAVLPLMASEADVTECKIAVGRVVSSFKLEDNEGVRLRLYLAFFAHVSDTVCGRAGGQDISPWIRNTTWYHEGVYFHMMHFIIFEFMTGQYESSLCRGWQLYHYANRKFGPSSRKTSDALETVWRLAQRAGQMDHVQEYVKAWELVVKNMGRVKLSEGILH
jgi:hypothetical protein